MSKDDMYYQVAQEYFNFHREKRELMRERDNISAKLEVIEGILTDLNDILCKHGNHIYEHFKEKEPQESEDKE